MAGIGLTLACGDARHGPCWPGACTSAHERAFPWGYGHSSSSVRSHPPGPGLHVAALYIGHEAHIGATTTVMTVAVPLAVFAFALLPLYTLLVCR